MSPLATRDKFSTFATETNQDKIDVFIAIEDWLNDGVDLPYGIAKTCIEDWFLSNKPAQNTWQIAGQTVRADAVGVPTFVVASTKDQLVEYDCAKALADSIPNATLYNPECGHIGMIAGGQAIKNVWQPIVDFIASCNSK